MKMWIGLGIGLLLTACAVASNDQGSVSSADAHQTAPEQNEQGLVLLENFGPAHELQNEVWLNTDEPLRLVNLRGQVVLLDMWTFG